MYFRLISILFFVQNALANEAEHHEPSIWDLKYPLLNFIIFASIIIWAVKKPLKEMFDKAAGDVVSQMNSAAEQSKDAQQKFNSFESKVKNLDSEIVKINQDYEEEAVRYSKLQAEETEAQIARLKRDVESKLAGEKKELMDNLNHEVLNLVVEKAKGTIKADSNSKKMATDKILAKVK